MTVFGRLFKARDKPRNSLNGSGYSFFFGNTASGKAVNERSAMQMSAVYACVRILAEAIASLPLHFYQYNDAGGKEKALGFLVGQTMKEMKGKANPGMVNQILKELL